MKPVFQSEFDPRTLAEAIVRGDATTDELFELIVAIDNINAEWDFTERLACHFCVELVSGEASDLFDLSYINHEALLEDK